MAAILPPAALAAVFAALRRRTSWQDALLMTGIIGGVAVVAITELLSLASLVEPLYVAGAWTIVLLGGVAALARPAGDSRPSIHPSAAADVLVPGLAIGTVLVITFVIAALAPPNTWDSMTYHMSRVAHWTYQATVAEYPTNIARQLYQPPWAEYAILQFQVLTGGDHFANFVQWGCSCGSVVAIAAIAGELGASRRAQAVSAAAAATLPMGILQASSTQNDYAEAFWIACAVYFCLRFRSRPTTLTAVQVGAAAGLAVLTKGTGYLFVIPVCVAAATVAFARLGLRAPLVLAALGLVVVAINAGFWARTEALFQNPLGPRLETNASINQLMSPAALVSNLIRDVAVHFQLPNRWLDVQLTRSVGGVHRLLGISPSDSRTTWPGSHFEITPDMADEDYAGNPLHLLAIVGAGTMVVVSAWSRQHRIRLAYLLGLVVAGSLFVGTLRWQPWQSRLELPLFVLGTPLVGLSMEPLRHRAVSLVIAVLLVGSAVPLFFNASRPLLDRRSLTLDRSSARSIIGASRTELYFTKRPELAGAYQRATGEVLGRRCVRVGLLAGADDWEYPLWVFMQRTSRNARIDHLNVANASGSLSPPGPSRYCALIDLVTHRNRGYLNVGGTIYVPAYYQRFASVWVPTQ